MRQPASGSHESVVHGLLSLQLRFVPGVQTPAWQVSAPLHTLPSLQELPLGMAACWHPETGSQESFVHEFPSSQLGAVPAAHAPAWQVSAPLQALPSLQPVPSATAVFRQPAAGSQESAVHGFPSLQLRGGPAVQLPAWQVSAPLHAFPSLHDVPFVTFVC